MIICIILFFYLNSKQCTMLWRTFLDKLSWIFIRNLAQLIKLLRCFFHSFPLSVDSQSQLPLKCALLLVFSGCELFGKFEHDFVLHLTKHLALTDIKPMLPSLWSKRRGIQFVISSDNYFDFFFDLLILLLCSRCFTNLSILQLIWNYVLVETWRRLFAVRYAVTWIIMRGSRNRAPLPTMHIEEEVDHDWSARLQKSLAAFSIVLIFLESLFQLCLVLKLLRFFSVHFYYCSYK